MGHPLEFDETDAWEPDSGTSARRPRAVPAMLFVGALLGFLLPFATVSCDGSVTFTGLELATANVDSSDDAELATDVEENGAVTAAVALGLIAVGLGLLSAGVRGWGVAAAAAMLALLMLPWIAIGAFADFELHVGYILSVTSLAVIAGRRRVESFRRRRALGRRAWPAALAGVVLALPIVLTMVLAAVSDPYV
jgi:hypothetical protein